MDVRRALQVLASDADVAWSCVGRTGEPCDPQDLCAANLAPFEQLTYDSRATAPNTLFICKGAAFKEDYLVAAAHAGASCYLAEHPMPAAGIPGIVVGDVRRAMARLACAFFGDPSRRLDVVGITGTKGKTTATFYVDAVLRSRGTRPSAMLTGLVVDDGFERVPSHNTTPESVELQRHLAHAVKAGCDAAVMEVSSQGLKYNRTLGTHFAVGVFTNIGEDHISPIEHPSFEDYFASKLRLFDQAETAVVNLDSDRADCIADAARRAPRVLTYAMDNLRADVHVVHRVRVGEGLWDLGVALPDGDVLELGFHGLGAFNVSNALAAIAACEALGVDRAAMARGLANVHVPGRMERYDSADGSIVGIVDYAHNEMSMEALLTCVREEFPGREITVVFGSTGDRATHRRAGLGRAAGRYADRIILTEDDPGMVPVAQIAAEIGAAVEAQGASYTVAEDRAEAVCRAVEGARRPAVVVLAGKGAETTIRRAHGEEPCASDAELLRAQFKGMAE